MSDELTVEAVAEQLGITVDQARAGMEKGFAVQRLGRAAYIGVCVQAASENLGPIKDAVFYIGAGFGDSVFAMANGVDTNAITKREALKALSAGFLSHLNQLTAAQGVSYQDLLAEIQTELATKMTATADETGPAN